MAWFNVPDKGRNKKTLQYSKQKREKKNLVKELEILQRVYNLNLVRLFGLLQSLDNSAASSMLLQASDFFDEVAIEQDVLSTNTNPNL